MKAFYTQVVRHRRIILIAFLLVTAICLFARNLVAVDYDINDYLPDESPSTVAIDKMNNEFDSEIPNVRVMIQNVTIPEALNFKQRLSEVDGVTDITWLDDQVDVTEPFDTFDEDIVDDYYLNNSALYTITVEEEKRLTAIPQIREIIGEDNQITGSAASTAIATSSTVQEVQKITIVAVLFVLCVLLLTTTSWVEPILILIGLGVAIVINSGTNLIFGEISFVTNAAGNVLQLAVSLDYSVFLIHRFEECRQELLDPEESMVDALVKSTSSIASSGLTTVIGFLALILMQFKLGPDLGLALAKGVAISLLTVFFFMPCLILYTYPYLDRTRHKDFMPKFKGLGKCIRSIRFPMVALFVLLLIPCYLASNANTYYYGASHIFGPDTQLGSDTEKIEDEFGEKDTYVLLIPKGDLPKQEALSDALQSLPQVGSIISYVDTVGKEVPPEYLESDTLEQLESNNYDRLVISVNVPYEGEQTFDLVQSIRNTAQQYYPDDYYLAGEGVSTYDLKQTVTADMVKVNFLAIGAVFLVLVLTLKSILLPVILVLSIETAIWINLSFPYFMDSTCFYIAYLIISSVQLGATVDYAILMTDRYKENRLTLDKKQAIVQTISDVTTSILTSGSVLTVVGLLMAFISTNQLLAQIGLFIGRGAILSLIIVMFVVPGLLSVFDSFVTKNVHLKHKFIPTHVIGAHDEA